MIFTDFINNAKNNPQKNALYYEGKYWSYGELECLSNKLAIILRIKASASVGTVAIYAERSPAFVVAILGVLRAGGSFVVLDSSYPQARLEEFLDLLLPDQLIVCTEDGSHFNRQQDDELFIERIVLPHNIRIESDVLRHSNIPSKHNNIFIESTAYYLFTSGTTGKPKCVGVSHAPLIHFVKWQISIFSLTDKDRFTMLSGLGHDPILRDIFTPLSVGGCVLIPDTDVASNLTLVYQWCLDSKPTVFHITPQMSKILLVGYQNKKNHSLDWVRYLFLGGDVLQSNHIQNIKLIAPNAEVVNFYGATETPQAMGFYRATSVEGDAAIPIGSGISDVELLIVSDKGTEVEGDEVGQIAIRTKYLSNGYVKGNSEKNLSNSVILSELLKSDNTPVYLTGDYGHYTSDGNIVLKGRLDDQVKIRGFRVELNEIICHLELIEGINNAICLATDSYGSEKLIVAYLVKTKNSLININDINNRLATLIPSYMVPSRYVWLDEIPLLPNGKVDRAVLPEVGPAINLLNGSAFVAPGNDFEQSLAAVWESILKIESVGVTDNFFDLGGDSLMTIVLIHEMEIATGIKFDVGDIFSYPSIKQLVAVQEGDIERQASSIVPLQREGSGVPLFCICGINRYQELANSLGGNQPIYGIYVSAEQDFLEDLMAGKKVDVSVEILAKAYYKAICRHQPKGPYQLLGLSFGGLLAVEIARMLKENGKEVISVILLDTMLPTGRRLRFLSKCKQEIKKTIKALELFCNKKLNRSAIGNVVKMDYFRDQAFSASVKRYESLGMAYDGKIVLIKAKDRSEWGKGVSFAHDYGWHQFVKGGIDVHEVAGDHLGIVEQPNVVELARLVRSYLEK